MKPLNPHCQAPFIAKDKGCWYIQFRFFNDLGLKRNHKKAYLLNKSDYLINGKEVNKKERQLYANGLLAKTKEMLTTHYFNPNTRAFESQDKSDLPFINFLREYIEYDKKVRKAEGSKKTYTSYVNVITDWLDKKGLKEIPLNKVDTALITEFLNSKVTPKSTTNRDAYLRYIKGCLQYCVDVLEVISKNPAKMLYSISDEDSETNKAYSKELRDEVLAECKKLDIHLWLLLRLIFYTLRRPSELLKLQYQDFDFETNSILFKSKIVKTNKTLYSYLPDHLMNDIKELMADLTPKPTDYFMGSVGKTGGRNKYDKRTFAPKQTPYSHFQSMFFDTIKTRLNLADGYTPYSFKHTGIVYCIEVMQWSDYDIIAYSGHTKIDILGRYSRDAKRPVKSHTARI